jgi:hypothetical protein
VNFYLLKKALSLNLSLLNVKCQKCFSSHLFISETYGYFTAIPKKVVKTQKVIKSIAIKTKVQQNGSHGSTSSTFYERILHHYFGAKNYKAVCWV